MQQSKFLRTYAIRGATTIKENSASEVSNASLELLLAILNNNALTKEDYISLVATITSDITAANPVQFMRLSGLLGEATVYFCCAEPVFEGALPLCIRVLFHVQTDIQDFKPKHVYLRGAKVLRTDLSS